MFSLGLEFSLAQARRASGPTAGVTAVDPVRASMLWLGFLVGRARSAGPRSRASSPARSSRSRARRSSPRRSTSRASAGALRELVVGILIVEDLIAILFMAVLTAVATGAGLSAAALGRDGRRARGVPGRAARRRHAGRAARRCARRAARPARDDARREHRPLLRVALLAQRVRLLGRARRVPRRLAGRRVGRGERDRAPRSSRCATCSPRSSSSRSAC